MAAAENDPKTIMVVEDEQIVLELTLNILREAGYTVLAARSGEEALKVASEGNARIDLLLTDIVMPGMTGGELVRNMRRFMPDLRILYMSGYTKYTVVNQEVLESVNSFIWKPFSNAELLKKVGQVLHGPIDGS